MGKACLQEILQGHLKAHGRALKPMQLAILRRQSAGKLVELCEVHLQLGKPSADVLRLSSQLRRLKVSGLKHSAHKSAALHMCPVLGMLCKQCSTCNTRQT